MDWRMVNPGLCLTVLVHSTVVLLATNNERLLCRAGHCVECLRWCYYFDCKHCKHCKRMNGLSSTFQCLAVLCWLPAGVYSRVIGGTALQGIPPCWPLYCTCAVMSAALPEVHQTVLRLSGSEIDVCLAAYTLII